MRGDVQVTSEPGKGSEFVVRLPLARPMEEKRNEEPSPTTVAFLTSSAEPIAAAGRAFPGIRLLATSDPLQLIAIARREAARLIALDVRTPREGAWRALAGMQRVETNGAARVLLLAPTKPRARLAREIGSFWVLPKPLSIEHALEAARSICGELAGSHALLADPDEDTRRILGQALASGGCAVHAVADGDEALEALGRAPINLAILNLLMPGLDAIALLARIRAHDGLRDLPVLVLVPNELTKDQRERLAQSADWVAAGTSRPARPIAELLSAGASPTAPAAEVLSRLR
jgi:CheY-like chemotaxis protein